MKRNETMKKLNSGKGLRLSITAIILGLMMLAPVVAGAANQNPGILPPDSKPYGLSYGEWSAKWWQWALSIPTDRNPLIDTTGEFCGEEQSGNVWFLAGTFGGSATRTCTIPAGKAILFPIINAECSTVEGNGETKAELSACAKDLIDLVTVKEATVDGVSLQNLDSYRVQSPLFTFTIPPDNILGIDTGGTSESSNSVSDGYWILLAPLSVGEHTVHFRGVVPEFNFETEVTYELTVK